MRDRYVEQLRRQNEGLLCDYCNSPSGHFSWCDLYHSGLPIPSVHTFTGVKPDDWDTTNEWRNKLADAKEIFTEDDIAYLKEMRITLGEQ